MFERISIPELSKSRPRISLFLEEFYMKSRYLLALLFLTATLFLTTTTLLAQTFRGTILGIVSDSSGAVLPGAKVTVHQVATGLERTTQTSADGSYAIPELPIGSYTVTI